MRIKYLDGFAFGLLVASLTLIALFWFFDIETSDKIETYAIELFAIVATLSVAWLALVGVRAQIQSNVDVENEKRMAKLFAAKATLPLALSGMVDIASNGIKASFGVEEYLGLSQQETQKLLSPSSETVATLKEVIESSDHDTQRWLAALLANLQVALSRSRELSTLPAPEQQGARITITNTRIELAATWARVYALSEHALKFARGSESSISSPLDIKRLSSAIWLNHIYLENYRPFVGEILNRRVEQSSPGNVEKFELID